MGLTLLDRLVVKRQADQALDCGRFSAEAARHYKKISDDYVKSMDEVCGLMA
ncbi:hypothetical protein BGX23_008287, partial [Mortierella sp. AD031]